MPKKPPSKSGGPPPGEDPKEGSAEDRPTVAPPFDPAEFAKRPQARPSPLGIAARRKSTTPPRKPRTSSKPRAPIPTLTDPEEIEEARKLSIDTPPSGPARRKPTHTGLLSLANARVPSSLPPRSGIPTGPPPPLQQKLIDQLTRDDPPSAPAPRVSAAPDSPPTEQEMNDRISLGDYSGALEIAEKLLAISPMDAAARKGAEHCRGVLRQMYTTRIGPLDRVPVVMVPRDQLRWLSIDHRAGFVLSLVDGVSSLDMILDVSGMPQLDTLRILSELAQQRIISFR